MDFIAERLDYSPEGLRERIRKALTRAREDHPGRLALRGAVKRSPSKTGEETTGERIVDPGANMAVTRIDATAKNGDLEKSPGYHGRGIFMA